MSEISTFDRAFSEARRRFAPVEEYIDRTFVEPTLRDLLEALAKGEDEVEEARQGLLALQSAGLDTAADYVAFNKVRTALYKAQLEVYAVVTRILRPIAPSLIAQIPFPIPSPEVRSRRQLGELTTGATIALAIIALIAAVAVAYILGQVVINVSQELSGVFIARARAQQFRDLTTGRLAAYNECLARGGDPEACSAAAAETVPTPAESGTETPEPGTLDPWPWIMIGVGGTLLTIVGVAAFRYYRRAQRLALGRVPVRNVAALPQRAPDLDGRKSFYNLEISGPAGIGRARRKRSRR